jgi:hypothetical protein
MGCCFAGAFIGESTVVDLPRPQLAWRQSPGVGTVYVCGAYHSCQRMDSRSISTSLFHLTAFVFFAGQPGQKF